ncbi:MAG: hypothetical protein OIF50_15500 [Flavobacteriaceae bacterium]|nr:hypothetical protein [Flavobacteriaceae bacterium]
MKFHNSPLVIGITILLTSSSFFLAEEQTSKERYCENLAFNIVEAYFNKKGDKADGFVAGKIFENRMYMCMKLMSAK